MGPRADTEEGRGSVDVKERGTGELVTAIASIDGASWLIDGLGSIFADGTGAISLEDVATVVDDDFDTGDADADFARSTMIRKAPIAVRNFAKLSGLTFGLE